MKLKSCDIYSKDDPNWVNLNLEPRQRRLFVISLLVVQVSFFKDRQGYFLIQSFWTEGDHG